ncbi:hypothetical protein [Pseudodesulfovibrio profundus]|nr:hypothetical protein [Pseudodesulfovibrio profundus]
MMPCSPSNAKLPLYKTAEWRLPTLAGTSAQVAYAEAIRHRAALETTRCVPQGREQAVLDVLSLATEAKWWIDNKETNYSEWVNIIRAKFGA